MQKFHNGFAFLLVFFFFRLFSLYNETALLDLRRPYNITRTFFNADITADTFAVVDRRNGGVYGDSLGGTRSFTDLAGNTAGIAVFSCNGTLIDRHTADPVRTVVGNKLYYFLGTGFDARAATFTFFIVDNGNAVDYFYRTEFTGSDTGAESRASVGTNTVTATELCGGNTVPHTGVKIFSF